MAAIEVCFNKVTGGVSQGELSFLKTRRNLDKIYLTYQPGGIEYDYSEQQLVDCGYNKNGASGCNGAWSHSYIKTIAEEGLDLTAEVTCVYS